MKCQVLLSIVLCVLTGVVRCIPEAKYLGCFDIAYSLGLNYHHHISDLTLGKCLSTCKILRKRYAGVEKSDNFCYCGGDIFEESAKKPDLLCNVECPDQPDLTCGGSWLISVYDMEKNESQTPSLNTSVGLLIGISSGVRLYNTSSIRTFDNIMTTSEWAYSVDYHLAKNLVFVISSGKLLRSTLDGKTSENALIPSLVKTVSFCEGLAVDWVHDKILWAKCGETVMIMSMDMASGNDTILVQREGEPKSIRRMEVDPYRGMVFWTADGTIESCELTGDNFQTNVSLAEVNVRAMALDLTQRRVYYVGTSNRSTSLFRMNYDGSDHREHFINMPQIKSIYGLSIVEGVVYWVNYGQRDVVYQAPLTLTEPSEVLLLTTIDRAVWHMRVIHPSLQSQPKRTACMEKGCSHICVNQSPTSVQCQCPRGLLLDQDGVSCHEVSAMGTSASRSELATAPAILIMAAAVGVIASLLVFLTDKYWSHLRAKLIAVPYTRESSQPVTVYDTTSDNVNLI